MKSILPLAAAALLSCGALLAQDTTPQTMPSQSPTTQAPAPTTPASQHTPETNQAKIAPGSVIPVQLTKTIDAKKAKTGDEVLAKVTTDMKTQTGQVLVPKDTKIIGHVTEAQARHKDEKESQLGIAFNQAVLNKQQVQLPMSIQAVIGQENNNSNNAAADNGGGGAPAPSAGGSSGSAMGGRSPNMGSGQSQAPNAPSGAAPSGNDETSSAGSRRPQITGQTQGVIGISNVTLSQASNNQQGSVLTSEKNNVKLESGTMLLLKVTQ